jgi:hypothetical protein
MSRRINLLGLVAMFMAARWELARAQVSSGPQDARIYAGEMFGDRLTDTPLSAGTPRPDNSFTSGGRRNSYFTSLGGVRFPAGKDSPLGRRPARGSGNDFALRAGCRSNLTDYSSMKG